jgi:tetratricopeptide (TPR) repeat protein
MTGTSEYIESYFQQTLSPEEKAAFEQRITTDEAFAKEVAFYVTTRQAMREALLEQKENEWKEATEEDTTPVISITKKTSFVRWITYAAAACLLLVASVYLFEVQTSPQKTAANYIQENYNTLSQTMDASHDSLQLGIAAYNNKDYNRALQLFQEVENTDSLNSDAKKYTGLVYLQQKQYDKAIQQFDVLANMKGLFSNPGDFLKATVLLQRDQAGDKEEAQKLLQKVVNENEEGSKEAAAWLKKF